MTRLSRATLCATLLLPSLLLAHRAEASCTPTRVIPDTNSTDIQGATSFQALAFDTGQAPGTSYYHVPQPTTGVFTTSYSHDYSYDFTSATGAPYALTPTTTQLSAIQIAPSGSWSSSGTSGDEIWGIEANTGDLYKYTFGYSTTTHSATYSNWAEASAPPPGGNYANETLVVGVTPAGGTDIFVTGGTLGGSSRSCGVDTDCGSSEKCNGGTCGCSLYSHPLYQRSGPSSFAYVEGTTSSSTSQGSSSQAGINTCVQAMAYDNVRGFLWVIDGRNAVRAFAPSTPGVGIWGDVQVTASTAPSGGYYGYSATVAAGKFIVNEVNGSDTEMFYYGAQHAIRTADFPAVSTECGGPQSITFDVHQNDPNGQSEFYWVSEWDSASGTKIEVCAFNFNCL